MGSTPDSQPVKVSFLGMGAERDMDTPCDEASTTLSASQSIQSTPAFYRGCDLRPRLNTPESMVTARSPHLCPISLGEAPPLIRLEESRLTAISHPEPTKTLKRLRRRRSKVKQSPSDGRAALVKAAKGVKGLKTLTTDTRGIQTATGQPQEQPVTPKRPACSRLLHQRTIKMDIKQGMRGLREGVLMSRTQRLEKACQPPSQGRAERQETSSSLRKTPDESNETKQPAFTPTTTTTGYSHQTSPSGYRQEALAEHRPPPTVARLDGSRYKAPTAMSLKHSSGNIPTNPDMRPEQSPISSVEAKSAGERQAGTTYLEKAHKAQSAEDCLRNRHLAKLAMLAQGDSSLHRSTFIQGQTLLATTPCNTSLIQDQYMQKSAMERELDLIGVQRQIHDRLEKHRHSENQDEGDIEDRLQRGWTLDDTDTPDEGSQEDNAGLEEQEKITRLERLLGNLKTLARLYLSTVWPMLDPRTLRVEHEGPMPFWKACLLMVLAVPAAAVGYVVAVQAVKLLFLLVWLMDYVEDGLAVWA